MTKLTYAEYCKASEAGMFSGQACACLGPQGTDEYCHCSMRILNMLTEDGQVQLMAEWKESGHLSKTERAAKWEEDQKDDLEKSEFRKKRLALIEEKKKKGLHLPG